MSIELGDWGLVMNKTVNYWLLTDSHFGHLEKMVQYCGRPVDYEERIHKALSQIPEKDCLIFLGDFCIGGDEKHHRDHIEPFKFKKIMIKGNHDKKGYQWYMNHGWDFVAESIEMKLYGKRIVFSHIPVKDYGYDFNIHGHFHNSDHRRHEPELLAIRNDKHILIQMEHEYKAINLEKLLNRSK
jgi:calcineurin-like phosphoesterase family protein